MKKLKEIKLNEIKVEKKKIRPENQKTNMSGAGKSKKRKVIAESIAVFLLCLSLFAFN